MENDNLNKEGDTHATNEKAKPIAGHAKGGLRFSVGIARGVISLMDHLDFVDFRVASASNNGRSEDPSRQYTILNEE